MKERIYVAVVFVSRVLRWVGWSGAAVFAGIEAQRFDQTKRSLEGALQESAVASVTLVELATIFIIAFASDRIWALVAEDLTARLPRKA